VNIGFAKTIYMSVRFAEQDPYIMTKENDRESTHSICSASALHMLNI
jgi:hypothetical protein